MKRRAGQDMCTQTWLRTIAPTRTHASLPTKALPGAAPNPSPLCGALRGRAAELARGDRTAVGVCGGVGIRKK